MNAPIPLPKYGDLRAAGFRLTQRQPLVPGNSWKETVGVTRGASWHTDPVVVLTRLLISSF